MHQLTDCLLEPFNGIRPPKLSERVGSSPPRPVGLPVNHCHGKTKRNLQTDVSDDYVWSRYINQKAMLFKKSRPFTLSYCFIWTLNFQDVMCAQLNVTFGFQQRYSKANVELLVYICCKTIAFPRLPGGRWQVESLKRDQARQRDEDFASFL